MKVAVNLEKKRKDFVPPNFYLDCLGSEKVFEIFVREKVINSANSFKKYSKKLKNCRESIIDGKSRLLFFSQIKFIFSKASEKGLKPILLKGLALEQCFYPDNVFRNFSDIDLLVKKDDFYQFKKLLEDNGYFAKKLTKKQLRYELKTQHAQSFKNISTGLEIDLHWNLIQAQYGVDTSRMSEEELFKNSITLSFQNFQYQTLSLENHFYFLCLHAYKNLFSNYKDLLDIFFALQSSSLDLDKVRDLTKGSVMDLILKLSIFQSNKVWGGSTEDCLSAQEKQIAEKIFLIKVKEKQYSEFEDLKLELLLRKGLIEKMKYLYFRCFIPHEDDWSVKLPDRLFFLYKMLKPLKVFIRAIRLTVKN